MTTTRTQDFDVTEIAEQVSRICDRFDPEIKAFYTALATLYKEDDLTGIDVMLKVVTGMLLNLIGQ
jgi:hypothetical protein